MTLFVRIWKKLFGVWETAETMDQQVARGGLILFFERTLMKGSQFVRTIIVARLIFPHDIGLFALASLGLSTVSVFVQLGINSAIIQEKKDVRKYLDNAWTANVIRGIFLAVVMFFSANLFGRFFDNDAIVMMIRVLGLLALMEGLENIGIVILQKELALNRQFFYDVFGNLIQIGAVILAALISKNAWAMVIGAVIGRLAYLILSYLCHPYRPRLNFDFGGSWHLFKFGRWIALGGIVSFFATRGDSLAIGKLLSVDQLAFYQMAFALGTLPAVEFVKTLGAIFFPLYAKMQEDKDRMRLAFTRIARMISAIIIPASVGMFVLAPDIVRYVYGSRWLSMVPVLYVAILFGLLKSFEFLVGPVFLGVGKPYVSIITMAFQAVVLFAVISPLTRMYGITGTAIAALLGLFAAQLVYAYRLVREIKINPFSIIGQSMLPLLVSAIMCLVLTSLRSFKSIDSFVVLISYIFAGVIVYVIAILLLDKLVGGKFKESYVWIKINI